MCQVPNHLHIHDLVGSPPGQGGGADPVISRIGLTGDSGARGKRKVKGDSSFGW